MAPAPAQAPDSVLLSLAKAGEVASGRYLPPGPADLLAYNRSVLRRSLESLDAIRLLTLPVSAAVDVSLELDLERSGRRDSVKDTIDYRPSAIPWRNRR